MLLGYLGIDQYGQHYHIKKYPRKELLKQLGKSFAQKMYIDSSNDSGCKHTGYVIAGLWITIYTLHEWIGKR